MPALPAAAASAPAPPPATISQLKNIVDPPPPVSWAPQAPGWWVLAALLLAALLLFAFRRWRRWQRNRYRREAQAELAALERGLDNPALRPQALAALPALVKRTVMAWAPRARVAALSGQPWLQFLDGTLAGKAFTQGAGRHLEALAYGGGIGRDELAALLALLHQWIDDHVPA